MSEGRAGARRPKLLATVVAALADGPGQLSWRLDNPAAGKPALNATLPVSPADAAALRQSMRACLAAR